MSDIVMSKINLVDDHGAYAFAIGLLRRILRLFGNPRPARSRVPQPLGASQRRIWQETSFRYPRGFRQPRGLSRGHNAFADQARPALFLVAAPQATLAITRSPMAESRAMNWPLMVMPERGVFRLRYRSSTTGDGVRDRGPPRGACRVWVPSHS